MATDVGNTRHICVDCRRQFVASPQIHRGYREDARKICLKMYVNGIGFRGIEGVTGVHQTTVINWLKQVGKELPDAYVRPSRDSRSWGT